VEEMMMNNLHDKVARQWWEILQEFAMFFLLTSGPTRAKKVSQESILVKLLWMINSRVGWIIFG